MRLSPLQPPARVYLCLFPLFRPSNLGYIGRGALLSRGNHPSFTHFDPAGTSQKSNILYHKSPHCLFTTPGPRGISCQRICSFPLFRPSNLEYIGRGALLNRGNRHSVNCLDPVAPHPLSLDIPQLGSRVDPPRATRAITSDTFKDKDMGKGTETYWNVKIR